MNDIKTSNVCYACGEYWEHANEYKHLCAVCRYDNRIESTSPNSKSVESD